MENMEKDNNQAKKRKMSSNSLSEELTQDELLSLIIKCANFAAVKHSRQRRCNREQTPYINHPIGIIFFKMKIFTNLLKIDII